MYEFQCWYDRMAIEKEKMNYSAFIDYILAEGQLQKTFWWCHGSGILLLTFQIQNIKNIIKITWGKALRRLVYSWSFSISILTLHCELSHFFSITFVLFNYCGANGSWLATSGIAGLKINNCRCKRLLASNNILQSVTMKLLNQWLCWH